MRLPKPPTLLSALSVKVADGSLIRISPNFRCKPRLPRTPLILASKQSVDNAVRTERQLKILQDQVSASHDQAVAALNSAIAIQRQTEITERPWLSVEVTPYTGITFVNGQQAVNHGVD